MNILFVTGHSMGRSSLKDSSKAAFINLMASFGGRLPPILFNFTLKRIIHDGSDEVVACFPAEAEDGSLHICIAASPALALAASSAR